MIFFFYGETNLAELDPNFSPSLCSVSQLKSHVVCHAKEYTAI